MNRTVEVSISFDDHDIVARVDCESCRGIYGADADGNRGELRTEIHTDWRVVSVDGDESLALTWPGQLAKKDRKKSEDLDDAICEAAIRQVEECSPEDDYDGPDTMEEQRGER